jgi:hypothetical protein
MQTSELFKVEIDVDRKRPYFSSSVNNIQLDFLVDTGANIPIFTLGVDTFLKYFPTAKRETKEHAVVTGFGKGETEATVFTVDSIRINSYCNTDYIVFKNFKVACCDRRDISSGLILPYGLFDVVNLMFMNTENNKKEIWINHKYNIYYCDFDTVEHGDIVRVFAYAQTED